MQVPLEYLVFFWLVCVFKITFFSTDKSKPFSQAGAVSVDVCVCQVVSVVNQEGQNFRGNIWPQNLSCYDALKECDLLSVAE